MSTENETVPGAESEIQTEPVPQDDPKPRVEISRQDKKFLKEALTRFTSCGRCSLFLAAYRLQHDDVELLAAVNNIEYGWLSLPWDNSILKLINKSYGCRIDVEAFYFESCCPDCHGSFIYMEAEDDQPNSLRLRM